MYTDAKIFFEQDSLAILLKKFNSWHGKECFYINPDIPPKKLKNAYSNYVPSNEPIIGLMDNTVFGSATEGCAICENGFFWKDGKTVAHILWSNFSKHRPLWSESSKNRIIFSNFPDTLFVMPGKAETAVKLFETLHDCLSLKSEGEGNITDVRVLLHTFQKNTNADISLPDLFCEDCASVPTSEKKIPAHDSTCSTSQFIQLLAKLDGYAIILIVLLRNNIPAKALDLLTRIPFLCTFGWAGKLLLGQAVDWLNIQIKEVGEPYMMENLVVAWKEKGIDYAKLSSQIRKTPEGLFDIEIKEDAQQLLDDYFHRAYQVEKNDINEVQNESTPISISSNNLSEATSLETKLALLDKLVALHKSGILTDEEFNIQKKNLLNAN